VNSLNKVTAAVRGGLDKFYITFPELAIFRLPPTTRSVKQQAATTAIPPETLDHLYYDHVLHRVIAHRGELVLHAGGIVIQGRAVAITADTGRGKSTLTASLHAAGHPILGDDALVVTNDNAGHHVRAVYPSLRLNPDSAATFFPGEEGRPMAHYSPKRHLPVGETAETAPLAALFVLGAPADAISARRLPPAEACMTIIANSFALDPTDKDRAREKLAKAATLANTVPIWELRYPRDYARLPEVHRTMHGLLAT
jgi:hypothetical protein